MFLEATCGALDATAVVLYQLVLAVVQLLGDLPKKHNGGGRDVDGSEGESCPYHVTM